MTIVNGVESQLNIINTVFPIMTKVWESKLPAINVYAISAAPHGEDRSNEVANRLMWESFIVLQEAQSTDVQQQRTFINNLLHPKDDVKKFIDILSVSAWWRIAGGAKPPSPSPSTGGEQPGVPPSASASSGATGRAPWWATTHRRGKSMMWKIPQKRGKTTGESCRSGMMQMNHTQSSSNAPPSATSTSGSALSCARDAESSRPLRSLAERSRHARYEAWQKSNEGRQRHTGNGISQLCSSLTRGGELSESLRSTATSPTSPGCAKTGCLYSAKLPGATALKALIDGHDTPDTANAAISKTLKG